MLVSAIDPRRRYVGLTSNVATRLAVHKSVDRPALDGSLTEALELAERK